MYKFVKQPETRVWFVYTDEKEPRQVGYFVPSAVSLGGIQHDDEFSLFNQADMDTEFDSGRDQAFSEVDDALCAKCNAEL